MKFTLIKAGEAGEEAAYTLLIDGRPAVLGVDVDVSFAPINPMVQPKPITINGVKVQPTRQRTTAQWKRGQR